MAEIYGKRVLQHSAAAVWDWIKDYGNIHRINPAIGASRIEGPKADGVGAVRMCEMKAGGFYLRERVTEWKEGESYTIDVVDSTMPLVENMHATLGVRELGSHRSEVYMRMSYGIKYGILGRAANALMTRHMMNLLIRMLFGKLEEALRESKTQAQSLDGAASHLQFHS